jgi:hypothetical protein
VFANDTAFANSVGLQTAFAKGIFGCNWGVVRLEQYPATPEVSKLAFPSGSDNCYLHRSSVASKRFQCR